MKKVDVTITSFHYDLLKLIIMLVVKSSKGAADIARTIAVCKYFAKFEKDDDVLKNIDFDSVELTDRTESFLGTKSLIIKSAQAGNLSAQYLLSKVMLVTSCRFWLKMEPGDEFVSLDVYVNRATRATETCKQDLLQASFLAHFMDNQSILFHTQLVRLFLCRCNMLDLVSMHRCLKLHFSIFTTKASLRCILSFNHSVDEMFSTVLLIVSFGRNNIPLWSKLEAEFVPAEFERFVRNFLRNPYPQSALELHEEANILAEYFFHHLVKKYFDEDVDDPSHNILCHLSLDVSKSFYAAHTRTFETERIKAIEAFDEALPPK